MRGVVSIIPIFMHSSEMYQRGSLFKTEGRRPSQRLLRVCLNCGSTRKQAFTITFTGLLRCKMCNDTKTILFTILASDIEKFKSLSFPLKNIIVKNHSKNEVENIVPNFWSEKVKKRVINST